MWFYHCQQYFIAAICFSSIFLFIVFTAQSTIYSFSDAVKNSFKHGAMKKIGIEWRNAFEFAARNLVISLAHALGNSFADTRYSPLIKRVFLFLVSTAQQYIVSQILCVKNSFKHEVMKKIGEMVWRNAFEFARNLVISLAHAQRRPILSTDKISTRSKQ